MRNWLAISCALIAIAAVGVACHDGRGPFATAPGGEPDPRNPLVVGLGNLRCGRAPTPGEAKLAEFLFGVEPESPTLTAKPVGLAQQGGRLLIADIARHVVLSWDPRSASLSAARLQPAPPNPIALLTAPDGGLLVADASAGVQMFSADGKLMRTFAAPSETRFRPADMTIVGGQLWATNSASHRIEVFDYATGAWIYAIGKRGAGRGEFGIPLGIANDGNGQIYVVDMLNARVQVLDTTGKWVRNLGGPGDRIGAFGRPKDVAITPDGFVLVTDAASQRVHVFDHDGVPLLAFGGPSDEGDGAICLPNSIAISTEAVPADRRVSGSFWPDYHVLVTEQIRNPGVRVYAWRSPQRSAIDAARGPRRSAHETRRETARVANPHWKADACGACHTNAAAPDRAGVDQPDQLCLSCHDGLRAIADPHPLGVIAHPEKWSEAASFPLPDGRISCLTCHEVTRHCNATAARPESNPGMVRSFDPANPITFCQKCHTEDRVTALNPHQRTDDDACGICHAADANLPRDGVRQLHPQLRDSSSRLCMRCHAVHWDFAPGGHLGKPLRSEMFTRLRERTLDAGERPGDRIALDGESVACYSCHNPHAPGLFPPNSPLGARASDERDARLRLRATQLHLCTTCHVP